MNELGNTSPNRPAIVNGLAIVGFISLVAIGISGAVYAKRFVPSVVGSIGAAAVSLGAVFNPAPTPSLSVVPDGSTTIPFGEASSAISHSIDDVASSTPDTPTKPVTPTAGPKTTATVPLGGTSPATLSGLPDLTVTITAVGYLATTSADSFVAANTVPAGARPAVRFTIKNVGTNVAGTWRFSASIPTQSAYIYQSASQQPLNPGDSIDYTLGFDQANKGADQMISITANFDHAVTETTTDNNSISAKVTILGS